MYNKSLSEYLICFHGPRLMIDEYGFHMELVTSILLSMHGSAEGHTGYIYRRTEDNKSSNAVMGCESTTCGIPCDPRFAIAFQLSQCQMSVTWKQGIINSAIKRSHEKRSTRSIAAKAIEELLEGPKERVEDLPFKVWRDFITSMILIAKTKPHVNEIHGMLDFFGYKLIWETTTILDLALWKMKMNEKSHQDGATQIQKRLKTDESIIRLQCRSTSGAAVVIKCVLPFLDYLCIG